MSDSYLGLRISAQKLYICDYEYNSSNKCHFIKDYFYIPYDFNFKGVNIKDCANIISTELINRGIKTKNIKVTIATHDITIQEFETIQQKNYLEDVKVLTAMSKKASNLSENTAFSLSYFITDSHKEKVVTQAKRGKLTKEKEISKINTITYVTPQEALDTIKELCRLLHKDLVTIYFSGYGAYRYYNKIIKQPEENSLFIHISDDYTIISVISDGKVIDQKIDNFSYSGIQAALSMYKNSLKLATESIESTITAINTIKLYTITREELDQLISFSDVERDQIIEAKNELTNYTLDFLDRLKVIIQNELKEDRVTESICIYNDLVDFPDLSYTISRYLNVKTTKLELDTNKFIGIENIEDKNYIVSMLGSDYKPINLDTALIINRQNQKLQDRVLYGIIGFSFICSIIIICYFLISYMIASNENTELNRKLAEAEAAERVYQQYMEINTAYETLTKFDESTKNDLYDLSDQLKSIAASMPTNKIIIESITATAGTEGSQGSMTLSVVADSKDTFAKFIVELRKLDKFVELEQSSVTDNLGDGSEYFPSGREVRGTIILKYELTKSGLPSTVDEIVEDIEPVEGTTNEFTQDEEIIDEYYSDTQDNNSTITY